MVYFTAICFPPLINLPKVYTQRLILSRMLSGQAIISRKFSELNNESQFVITYLFQYPFKEFFLYP